MSWSYVFENMIKKKKKIWFLKFDHLFRSSWTLSYLIGDTQSLYPFLHVLLANSYLVGSFLCVQIMRYLRSSWTLRWTSLLVVLRTITSMSVLPISACNSTCLFLHELVLLFIILLWFFYFVLFLPPMIIFSIIFHFFKYDF